MKMRRTVVFAALSALPWLVVAAPLRALQQPPAVVLTPAEMREFLLNARILRTRAIDKGLTGTRRATLSDGRITHDAHIQTIDEAKPFFRGNQGTEVNFKDSYRFNIAAYHLALALGLDHVPMSVERRVSGKLASVTWWVDDVLMEEGERLDKSAWGPEPERTASQIFVQRVFDELIRNTDRNLGNTLWTRDWKMWMIDHTRAFRLDKTLKDPGLIPRCERTLFAKMKTLTASDLQREVGDALSKDEMEALFARRDALVAHFDGLIATQGEAAVLYTMPGR